MAQLAGFLWILKTSLAYCCFQFISCVRVSLKYVHRRKLHGFKSGAHSKPVTTCSHIIKPVHYGYQLSLTATNCTISFLKLLLHEWPKHIWNVLYMTFKEFVFLIQHASSICVWSHMVFLSQLYRMKEPMRFRLLSTVMAGNDYYFYYSASGNNSSEYTFCNRLVSHTLNSKLSLLNKKFHEEYCLLWCNAV
jgi:hypothetical protein